MQKKGAFTWFNLIAESVLLGQASSVVYGVADIFQVFAPRNHSVECLADAVKSETCQSLISCY